MSAIGFRRLVADENDRPRRQWSHLPTVSMTVTTGAFATALDGGGGLRVARAPATTTTAYFSSGGDGRPPL